jgi:hypothetical protein
MTKYNKYLMAAAILTAGFAFAAVAPSALAQSQGSGKGNATSSAEKDKKATTTLATSTKGNATSSAAKDNATSSGNSANGTTTSRGEEHRSEVARFVQTLLSSADRLGGIGEQVRVIAREQSSTTKQTVDAIKAIEERSPLKIFLAGSDYKNIGVVRSQIANTESRLERLQAELAKEGDTAAVMAIQAEIQTIKDEQAKLETFLKANEGKSGLFGWLVRLF